MAPALPWGTASTGSGAAAQPVSSAAAPARQEAPGASPFASVVGEGRSARVDLDPDLDEDDEWDEPEPSYTWLHYIVLVVVAFVLGALVWNLLLDGPDTEDFGTEEASAPVTVTDEGGSR